MTYAEQWKTVSGRIRGLMRAGELHARFLGIRSNDGYGRGKQLRQQCEGVLSVLDAFRRTYDHSLPREAIACINAFIDQNRSLICDTGGTADSLNERVWAALVVLGAFETEMAFILSDSQEIVRARSERAFGHLQRSLVADEEFRGKWQRAFRAGEVACERLGGVHLLSHGIFAFKINGAGERTDLVFQDLAGNLAEEQRYVDGFVLTEWKTATSLPEAEARF